MPRTVMQLEKLSDSETAATIMDAVSRLRGVNRVNIRVASSKLMADYRADEISPHEIKVAIEQLGYRVVSVGR